MTLRVSVIGTNYLGATHAAGMAEFGHEVVGVDIDPARVKTLNAGQSHIYEVGLEPLLTSHTSSGRLRFTLDDVPHRAQALALLSPMVSKALTAPVALEAAILDPHRAGEVFRLAARAMVSDWRDDPSVTTVQIQTAHAWARDRIPVLLDGEPSLMERDVAITFERCAFRALAPKPQPVRGSA